MAEDNAIFEQELPKCTSCTALVPSSCNVGAGAAQVYYVRDAKRTKRVALCEVESTYATKHCKALQRGIKTTA